MTSTETIPEDFRFVRQHGNTGALVNRHGYKIWTFRKFDREFSCVDHLPTGLISIGGGHATAEAAMIAAYHHFQLIGPPRFQ